MHLAEAPSFLGKFATLLEICKYKLRQMSHHIFEPAINLSPLHAFISEKIPKMHRIVSYLIIGLQIVQILLCNLRQVQSHGMLMEPPGRSSLWRFPEFVQLFDPPVNYDDNQLFCGGFKVQYKQNGGRCGPCGDPYNEAVPRENESGGLYGQGIITRQYKPGQTIDVQVLLTQSHKGYFQFRLCEHNNFDVPETQTCFNKHLLEFGDETPGTKYHIDKATRITEYYTMKVKLPPSIQECKQCVLQWHYRTGNSWGNCTDGTQALGCGNQEVFRGCSDIAIGNYKPTTERPRPPTIDSEPDYSPPTTKRPVPSTTSTTVRPTTTNATTTRRPGTTVLTTPEPSASQSSTARPAPAAKPTKPALSKPPMHPIHHPPKPKDVDVDWLD